MSVRAQATITHLIEVRLRPEHTDAEGLAALGLLRTQGLPTLIAVRVARLYEIVGTISANQALQVVKELLCDAVTQEHRFLTSSSTPMNGANFWRIEVWLKSTVTDPAGETVCNAIAEMSLPRPQSVRCALVYHLVGRSNKPTVEKAVWKCLANALIHRVVVSETHP